MEINFSKSLHLRVGYNFIPSTLLALKLKNFTLNNLLLDALDASFLHTHLSLRPKNCIESLHIHRLLK